MDIPDLKTLAGLTAIAAAAWVCSWRVRQAVRVCLVVAAIVALFTLIYSLP